jgi:acetyl esterase
MQAVLDQLAGLGGKPLHTLPPAEARKQPTPADAVMKLLAKQGKSTEPEAVARVDNRTITGSGSNIPIRIYTPKGEPPFPAILYIHGGGWVVADLDTYDASARALTNAASAIVVSTHYRRAPEHPYPAAHDDAFAAYRWLMRNAESLGGDAARIAVAGESAGGNMAAVVAIRARDQRITTPVHQLLVYPVAGTDLNTESYRESASAKPLNKRLMAWFLEHYLGDRAQSGNPEINLAKRDDLEGLPSATVITADIDPLRTDGQMLARALDDAGVEVTSRNFQGVTHEFFGMGAVVPTAREAVQLAGSELRKAFRTTRGTSGQKRPGQYNNDEGRR